MKLAFCMGFTKMAGGPGSGVTHENAQPIEILEESPLMSIGKRSAFMERNKPIKTGVNIPIGKIQFRGQRKYVPKKLMGMIMGVLKGDSSLWDKPAQFLIDSQGQYHIIDGHHRVLAAIIIGRPTILADVYSTEKLGP